MAAEPRPTRREQRERRREEERDKREAALRKSRTTRYLMYGVIAVLVVAGILLASGPITSALSGGSSAVQDRQFDNQGQEHITAGAAHAAYNSNPPTSGPHLPDPARWGIYDQPIPDETLVHNLEHGGIVIGWNCPAGCPDLVAQLKALAGQYRSKVVLAPRPDPTQPNRMTLTAWRWLDAFDEYDDARIRAFIAAHKDKGPELLPD